MNAVEFKEKLDKSREADVAEFLKEYEEKWNETVEETIDKILSKHANDSKTTEPFKIIELNYELLEEEGELEDIDEMPNIGLLNCDYWGVLTDDKYRYLEGFVSHVVKGRWFWKKTIEKAVYSRVVYKKTKEISYYQLSSLQKIYFNKILTDKGFFVGEDSFEESLCVYWNKEQYDLAINNS